MATYKRQKELERLRYQRQQQRRSVEFVQRRGRQQAIAGVSAVIAVIVGLVFLSLQVQSHRQSPVVTGEQVASSPTEPEPGQAPPSVPMPPSTVVPASTGADGQITCQYYDGQPASRPVSGKPATTAAAVPGQVNVTLTINNQPVTIRLETTKAPCTTRSFVFLAQQGFYDNTTCHRMTKGNPAASGQAQGLSVLQCGDPSGSGSGGPGYSFGTENLPTGQTYPAGTLAMAKSASPNSNGSQFFIVYADSALPPDYTVFGQVTSGLPLVAALGQDLAEGSDQAPTPPVALASAKISGA